MTNKLISRLSIAVLVITLGMALVFPVGCRGQQPVTTPGLDLSKTQVPNVDLDAYVYVKQDKPTKMPKSIIGTPSDVDVEWLGVWGVADGDQLTIGGMVTFTSADDAARVRAQIPAQALVWTSLSDRTLYFVRGSGAAADKLKAAISKNDFKSYNDQSILAQAARLPNGGNTKLAAIAIVKPGKPMVKLIANYSDPKLGDMIDQFVTLANLQPVIMGLYAPGHMDMANMAQRAASNAIWESELGVIALVKSGLPGVIVGPIAGKYLENAGFTVTKVGGLDVYKGVLAAGRGKSVPALLNLDGSSLTIAVSGKEPYAEALITSVKK